jgi:hypothetical protein
LLRKARPKTPHRGFISSALVLLSTLGILGILFIVACHRIYLHSGSSEGGGKSASSLQGIPGISEVNASIISEGGTLGVSEGANALMLTQKNWTLKFILTDSSFFVCDNSTTGHICNDIRKFVPGSIRQTNNSLTTANA